jgi:hypothetical protein
MNPLDKLADINTPTAVSVWPLAWGYWLAIAIVILLLVLAIRGLLKYKRDRRVKVMAIKTLRNLDPQSADFALEVQVVLKNLCKHYLHNLPSATLYGEKWRQLLLELYKGKQASKLEQALASLQIRLYANPSTASKGEGAGAEEAFDANKNGEYQNTTQANMQLLNAAIDLVETSFPLSSPKAQTKEVIHV